MNAQANRPPRYLYTVEAADIALLLQPASMVWALEQSPNLWKGGILQSAAAILSTLSKLLK